MIDIGASKLQLDVLPWFQLEGDEGLHVEVIFYKIEQEIYFIGYVEDVAGTVERVLFGDNGI